MDIEPADILPNEIGATLPDQNESPFVWEKPVTTSVLPSRKHLLSRKPSLSTKVPATGRQPQGAKIHACEYPDCGRSFVRLANLQKHQKLHPTKFACRYAPCDTAFGSADDRNNHEVSLHNKNEHAELVCYICGFGTARECNMEQHFRRCHKHLNNREAIAKIVDSRGLFMDQTGEVDVNHHHKITPQEKDSPGLTCYMCDFSTATQAEMQEHVACFHAAIDMEGTTAETISGINLEGVEMAEPEVPTKVDLICYICGFRNFSKTNMNKHIWRNHKDVEPTKAMARILKDRVLDKSAVPEEMGL